MSPRKRRRLARVGLALVALVAVGAVVALLPEAHPRPDTFSGGKPQLFEEQPPLKLTAADRREIGETLERFVRDGLGRNDLAAAWELASPDMRASVTRAEWRQGTLPVMPYDARPGDARRYRVEFAYGNEVGAEVFLHPVRKGADRIVFAAGLERVNGRWLVDSMVPAVIFGGDGAPSKAWSQADLAPLARGAAVEKGRVSPVWLLVVLAAIAASLVVAVAFGVRASRRGA